MNEFIDTLLAGGYKKIIVCTGAGISASAGLHLFRGNNGLDLNKFTRSYAQTQNPQEYLEFLKDSIGFTLNTEPTKAHRFCAWLQSKGWLSKIYTQNIDGLHLKGVDPSKVVEWHGTLSNPVLYGDPINREMIDNCTQDFSQADLVIVMGTSSQVAPFCALHNLAPPTCQRVLVNPNIRDCLSNAWDKSRENMNCVSYVKFGKRKVTLRPQWANRKKWVGKQLVLSMTCDDFSSLFEFE
jgi:NAD-dependent deacetylase